MEARMGAEMLQAVGFKGRNDKFLVLGLGGDRKAAFRELEELWPGLEIIAPTEKRMVRPRRKTSKEPIWIERPLFMEYAAVSLMDEWKKLFTLRWVSFVLGADEKPAILSRNELQGMIVKAQQRSWEGELVEVISGPLKGSFGIYERGHIRVNMFGGEVRAKVRPYDISLA